MFNPFAREGTNKKLMMAAARANDSAGTMPPAPGKKTRKPYTITRPREKWAADEHERFLHALLRFGRDWKRIEQFVTTKTATQIRSHAQKYFLKAQKLGLAAALPPPHPRRGAVIAAHAACSGHPDDNAAAAMWPTAATPPMSSTDFVAPSTAAQAQQSAEWAARGSAGARHHWPNCSGGEPSDATAQEDGTIQLPLSPDDPRFALVYRFVGDVFGSGAARPVEAQLQRLWGVDPVVVDTILLVLRNLQDNLFAA